MKIGINLLLWTDAPSPEHLYLLQHIKNWGYDGVELPLDYMTEESVRLYSDELRRLGLEATGIISIAACDGDPISDDPALRTAALAYYRRCIDKAVALGITVIGGPLYQGLGRFTGDGPSETEIARCVDFFKVIAPYAQERNIVLAGEPINRFETYFVNTIAQATAIIDAVDMPNFGLHVDTYHGNFEELDVCAAWEKAGSRVRHVHISENTRGIPGTGSAVFPDIFRTLKKIGYDGWLTIEAFSRAVPALSARLHIWREMAAPEDIAVLGLQYIDSMLRQHGIRRG